MQNGETGLHVAVAKNHVSMIELLLVMDASLPQHGDKVYQIWHLEWFETHRIRSASSLATSRCTSRRPVAIWPPSKRCSRTSTRVASTPSTTYNCLAIHDISHQLVWDGVGGRHTASCRCYERSLRRCVALAASQRVAELHDERTLCTNLYSKLSRGVDWVDALARGCGERQSQGDPRARQDAAQYLCENHGISDRNFEGSH